MHAGNGAEDLLTQQPAEPAATPQADGADSYAPDETVHDVLASLYADGRAYAAAEGERQKLRAGLVVSGVRDAAIFAGVAIMLVFATLVAFLIGLIIALAPRLGPLWATLAVLGASLLVALVLLLLARARIGRMKKAIAP